MKANDESHLTAGCAAPISPALAAMPERIAYTDQPGQNTMARRAAFAIGLAALIASCAHSAQARGGRGFGRGGHGMHRAQFAGDRRHGNDAYAKAAPDERDRLLTNRIKSICRGC
jgi:hypothetical protein